MNIAYFLLPKNRVAYLYDDYTFRQGLEKMRSPRLHRHPGHHPQRDSMWAPSARGISSGSSSPTRPSSKRLCSMKDMEQLRIRDILRGNHYPPVRITVSMEELMQQRHEPELHPCGRRSGQIHRHRHPQRHHPLLCRQAAIAGAAVSAEDRMTLTSTSAFIGGRAFALPPFSVHTAYSAMLVPARRK